MFDAVQCFTSHLAFKSNKKNTQKNHENRALVKYATTRSNPQMIFLHQCPDKFKLKNQTLPRNRSQSKEQVAMRGHLSSGIIISNSQVATCIHKYFIIMLKLWWRK